MFNLIQPFGVDDNSGTFNLFVMLLVVAVSSMLASNLPAAVMAATAPVVDRGRAQLLPRSDRFTVIFSAPWR